MDIHTIANVIVPAIVGVLCAICFPYFRNKKQEKSKKIVNPTIKGIIVVPTLPNATYDIDETPHLRDLCLSGNVFMHYSTYISMIRGWKIAASYPVVMYNFDTGTWVNNTYGTMVAKRAIPVTEIWNQMYTDSVMTPKEYQPDIHVSAIVTPHEFTDGYPKQIQELINWGNREAAINRHAGSFVDPERIQRLELMLHPTYMEAMPAPKQVDASGGTSNDAMLDLMRAVKDITDSAKQEIKDKPDPSIPFATFSGSAREWRRLTDQEVDGILFNSDESNL